MVVATIVCRVAGCAGLGTEVQAMAAAVRTGSTARATRLRVRPTPSLESGFIVGRPFWLCLRPASVAGPRQ